MASRRPDFRLAIPGADADAPRPQNALASPSSSCSPRSPRSPRFHEDFDAPFSEALLNASRTTVATDATDAFSSSHSRHSTETDAKRASSSAGARKARAQSRLGTWHHHAADASRRATVNAKIRDWARRSLVFARKAPDQPDDVEFSRLRRRPSKPPSGASASAPGGVGSGTASRRS